MKNKFYALFLCILTAGALSAQVLDNGFGKKGRVVLPANNDYVEVTVGLVQPDGKIIISGYDYDEFFYSPSIRLWRLTGKGEVDSSFGYQGALRIGGSPFGGLEYGGYTALLPDGRIVGAGSDFDRDGIDLGQVVLFRLKPDGSYDSSFGINGKAYANFGGSSQITDAFLRKPDGKLVVTGRLRANYSGTRRVALAQFLPDGTRDSAFGVNGAVELPLSYKQIQGVALASVAGNKVVAGFDYIIPNPDGYTYHSVLARFNADGSLDTTFGTGGIAPNRGISGGSDYPRMSLAVQSDGKIVEYLNNYSISGLFRYNANGSTDSTFGKNGLVRLPPATAVSVTIDAQGRILTTGSGSVIRRFLPCGDVDSSFGVNGSFRTNFYNYAPGSSEVAEVLRFQPDGKLLNLGYIYTQDGRENVAAARYVFPPASPAARIVAGQPAIPATGAPVIYPNPVHDVLTIQGLKAAVSYTVSITNAAGKQLAVRRCNGTAMVSLPVNNLAAGIYSVTLLSATGKTTLRFEKQ